MRAGMRMGMIVNVDTDADTDVDGDVDVDADVDENASKDRWQRVSYKKYQENGSRANKSKHRCILRRSGGVTYDNTIPIMSDSSGSSGSSDTGKRGLIANCISANNERKKLINAFDVTKRSLAHASRNNRLHLWMIFDAINSTCDRIEEMYSTYGWAKKLSVDAFYDAYCRFRDPPSKEVMNTIAVVGVKIVHPPDDRDNYVYIVLFIIGWGAQFICIDPTKDENFIKRSRVMDFLDSMAEKDATLVYGDIDSSRLLKKMLRDISPPDEYRMPEHQVCMQLDDGVNSVEHLAWNKLGIDVISWRLDADVDRLLESPPKNPIEHSFFPEWNLRSEQMTYLAIQAMIPALLIAGLKCPL